RSGSRSGLFLLAASNQSGSSEQGSQNDGVLHCNFLYGKTLLWEPQGRWHCSAPAPLGTWRSSRRRFSPANNYRNDSSILACTDRPVPAALQPEHGGGETGTASALQPLGELLARQGALCPIETGDTVAAQRVEPAQHP